MSPDRNDVRRTEVRRAYDEIADDYLAERAQSGDDTVLLGEFCDRLPENARVLDAGCGAGRPIARRLAAEYDLVGIDFSREQVMRARENVPAGRFCQSDMTQLGLSTEAFDGVCAYYSVIHVPIDEHPDVIREFHRVLRPGGYLLLTVGSSAWEGSNDDWLGTGVEMHWSTLAPEGSTTIVEDAGFEVRWRRTVNDSMGDTTDFVLARKSG
ncbi:class I SAM-dependent methyltransferase [Haladaptatus caseinilyticus]|uniref:class I SAM-dependent methyltransferase n=1 Tax=Haladaptatus caseinilyticus TaxID=2993314 RepID=UPI00224B6E58|nr:class I SAM-dependent methyltransferase [Haladaptatus caseinilyticus]